MINRQSLSKIGIGTWGMGGFMERDQSVNEQGQIESIVYQLKQGMNIVQANNIYSDGRAVEILGKALSQSGISREQIFVIQADYKADSSYDAVENEVNLVMKSLHTDYIDTFQFRSKAFYDNDFDALCLVVDKLLSKNIIRNTSITNASLGLLKRYHQRFGDKLFSTELCHNFEIRENENAGIIEYAKDNNIEIVIFQPLRRNRTAQRNWPLLVSLANKYKVTQNQIILAWLVSRGFYVLTKSQTIEHIEQNLAASKLVLDISDIAAIDSFRINGYKFPEIDWEWTGKGVTIDQLSNVFDDDYDKQTKQT